MWYQRKAAQTTGRVEDAKRNRKRRRAGEQDGEGMMDSGQQN